jgi:hypothetical protein
MAIKVNGTTVINDSRALQNIASVDSTTVTALGNAGVGGGATELITNWTNVPSSSSWSVSLSSSYDIIRIFLNRVSASTNGGVWQYIRLQHSGGTETHYPQQYWYGSGNTRGNDSFIRMGDVQGTGSSATSYTSGYIDFIHANNSSRVTQYHSSFLTVYSTSLDASYSINTHGNFGFNRAHTSALFTTLGSPTFSGGQYLVMGVNL